MTWWSSALLAWAVVATVVALALTYALAARVQRRDVADDADDLWTDPEPDEATGGAAAPRARLRLGSRTAVSGRG
jgi:hypothetical protein